MFPILLSDIKDIQCLACWSVLRRSVPIFSCNTPNKLPSTSDRLTYLCDASPIVSLQQIKFCFFYHVCANYLSSVGVFFCYFNLESNPINRNSRTLTFSLIILTARPYFLVCAVPVIISLSSLIVFQIKNSIFSFNSEVKPSIKNTYFLNGKVKMTHTGIHIQQFLRKRQGKRKDVAASLSKFW